jgi:hypothetical protein
MKLDKVIHNVKAIEVRIDDHIREEDMTEFQKVNKIEQDPEMENKIRIYFARHPLDYGLYLPEFIFINKRAEVEFRKVI